MPHRARRSSPTNDATDLTDEPWAAIAPLVITPSSKGGFATVQKIRSSLAEWHIGSLGSES